MLRVIGSVVLLALASPGACGTGSSDSGQSGAADQPSPVEQCQTYATTWCNKFFDCYVQVGRIDESELQSNVDECTQGIIDRAPCSAATSVSSDYDTCISQIKGLSCSKFDVPRTQAGSVTPPTSCSTAFSFE